MIAHSMAEPIGLRVETVAQLLDVSPSTVIYWIRQGRLPAFKVGRSWRVRRSDLFSVTSEEALEGAAR